MTLNSLPLTFRQCRDAARVVRHTEHGPEAVRQLRGERVGFSRSRPGLALLLYLAAAQGRVVWRSPAAFAVLEPAATAIAAAVPGTDEAMIVVRNPGDGSPAPVPARVPAFLGVFFGGSLVVLAAQAWIIVDQGPAGAYFDALAWLLDQAWLFGDLGTTAPAWAPARVYGLGAQLLGVVALGVLAKAGWLAYRAHQAAATAGERAVERVVAEADAGLVFVNHRKGTHRGLVKALRRDLAARLGEDQVFMDYRSMPLGSRYPNELRDALKRCRVLLAIIHDGWLADLRVPRDGLDWVHYEIATALGLGKVVIAVYFDDAPRLDARDLPPDIRELALRQDCRVRWHGGNLDDDLDRLARDVIAAARSHETRPGHVTS
jgi:hypothetical protein